MNFHSPTYVVISRALAKRAYTTITGNTRMHDLGNVEAWRGEKRIRDGYWGVASERVKDLAGRLDFAEALRFKKVVLVSHSAGVTAVQTDQAQTQDTRVAGVVLASGSVRPGTSDVHKSSGTDKGALHQVFWSTISDHPFRLWHKFRRWNSRWADTLLPANKGKSNAA